ncbi:hypothetical protein QR98_0029770 [Sarcoptes scabiei]|uniref:C2H2-type domain-containing protein n=1 Tax=Sarcoptes scabiei TaxID=52283 RepID=A0A132A0Q5_SARSC|nr:hypothetical protein QR98_0029770 [Sarcoptes scabiei]
MSFENDFNQSDSSLDFSNGRDLYDEDITSQTDYRILLDDLNDINIKENFSEEISPIFKESTTIYKSKAKEFNDDVGQCGEESSQNNLSSIDSIDFWNRAVKEIIIKRYQCRICQKIFDDEYVVKSHFLTAHQNCFKNKDRNENNAIESHVNNEIAQSNLLENSSLPANEKIVRNKKPRKAIRNVVKFTSKNKNQKTKRKRKYPCDWPDCNYIAINSVHLKSHKNIHTKERPYRCTWNDCDDKKFVCEFEGCSRKFIASSHLRKHAMIHLGLKPFQCGHEGCEYRSNRPIDVTNHQKKHCDLEKLICLNS